MTSWSRLLKREKGVDDWPGMTFTRETTMDDGRVLKTVCERIGFSVGAEAPFCFRWLLVLVGSGG
jgi:hypothetical protein